MAKLSVRHLVSKQQKSGTVLYYWQPPKALRSAGFLPQRLARATNDPLDAAREAEALNREVDDWRRGDTGPRIKNETLPWLIRLYKNSPEYTNLSHASRATYDSHLRRIEAWSRKAKDPPLRSLSRKICRNYYRGLLDQLSPAGAATVMRVLSVLLAFAVDEELITTNPAAKLKIKTPNPRCAVWKPEEIEVVCRKAIEVGRPSVALAVRLAADLGQRKGDILRLTWSQYRDGAFRIRQEKTKTYIEVPASEVLKEQLAGVKRMGPVILVNEETGRPWRGGTFGDNFATIREDADLSHLQFRDLRRTAVVRLGEAGCSVPEIAAITGHTIDGTTRIIEVYLPRNSTMARNAVTKLEEYKRRSKLEASDGNHT